MSIFKKSALERDLQKLELRYKALRDAVAGKEPNPNIYMNYEDDPHVFRDEYTEVDLTDVEYALHDLDGVLKRLRRSSLAKLRARPR